MRAVGDEQNDFRERRRQNLDLRRADREHYILGAGRGISDE